ncbi:MAG: FG-GAP-like repeat-containing protein, partial [Kofleriaceae bacterium]
MQRYAVAAIAGAGLLAGCGDAITLEIASDRPVPHGIDAICVGIADDDPAGGQFGRAYRLEGALAALPQTLRVEAGGADSALAWVRGDRGGVPAIRAARSLDFGRDVSLELARCPRGSAGAPAVRGTPVGPANARLVASLGAGGTVIVAIGESGESAVIDARGGALVATPGPTPPPGVVVAAIPIDLDGDCDDDLIVATSAAPPAIWRRDHHSFVPAGELGTTAVAALAAADVDRDGDLDVVTGAGNA